MRSLVNKKPDRMSVDCDFEDEIGRRRPGLEGRADNAVMVGVDQCLVQIKHQHLLGHHR